MNMLAEQDSNDSVFIYTTYLQSYVDERTKAVLSNQIPTTHLPTHLPRHRNYWYTEQSTGISFKQLAYPYNA